MKIYRKEKGLPEPAEGEEEADKDKTEKKAETGRLLIPKRVIMFVTIFVACSISFAAPGVKLPNTSSPAAQSTRYSTAGNT